MYETFYEPTEQDLRDYAQDCKKAMQAQTYYLPEIPYSPIDALNRRAAALGSPMYSRMCSTANYNGHRVSVTWNDYRGYYITQYYYGERVVLARGKFAYCLRAAIDYYKLGHLGACISISPREDDMEADQICQSTPDLLQGELNDADRSWWTWRHTWASRSARDTANPNALRTRFDWDLMQAAQTEEEYEQALKAKYGNSHTF